MKKKLLALMLAMVMMLSLSVTAFAADDYEDASSVTITKVYTATNSGTTSPAETFTLVQVGDGEVVDGEAESAPALGTITGAAYGEGGATTVGAEASITVNLPTYDTVGIYKYTLTEVEGTTAGVTYFDGNIYLVVTVINDDNGNIRVAAVHTETTWDGEEANNEGKTDEIENTYSAGSLSVTKSVTGNLGDKEKEFTVTVTFTAPTDETVKSTISYTVGTETLTITPDDWTDGVAEVEVTLSDEDTITFTNIPYGVTYTVEEDDYTVSDGYDEADYTYSDDDKEIDGESDTVTIVNNKDGEVDTGISLDSLPYILMLIVVAAGVVVMISRRRLNDRF